MITKRFWLLTHSVGLGLGCVWLGLLTGCVRYVDRPVQGSVYEVYPAAEPTFMVQDDYVYYPNYQVYYSNRRQQYAYREHNVWVARPVPPRVPLHTLRASPSVRMNFHDSPAKHDAVVIQQYPKNWTPPDPGPSPKPNPKDNPPGGSRIH